MDVVNSPGGFTAIRHLETNAKYTHAPADGHYLVQSSLTGAQDMFARLVTAVGYPAEPVDGYSVRDVFERQIKLADYINALSDDARPGWRAWADRLFRTHVLARAGLLFVKILTSANPKRPAAS